MTRDEIKKKWLKGEFVGRQSEDNIAEGTELKPSVRKVSQEEQNQETTPQKRTTWQEDTWRQANMWQQVQERADQIMETSEKTTEVEQNKSKNKSVFQDARDLLKVGWLGLKKTGQSSLNYIENMTLANSEEYRQLQKRMGEQLYMAETGKPLLTAVDPKTGIKKVVNEDVSETPTKDDINNLMNHTEEEIQEIVERQSNPVSKLIAELTPSMVQSVAGMGASAINPALGLDFWLSSGGGDYIRSGENRGLTGKKAVAFGTILGALDSAFEAVGAGITKRAFTEGAKGTLKGALKNLGVGALENAVEEAVMEPSEEGMAKLFGGEYSFEDMPARMWDAGWKGAVSGAILDGASAGIGSATKLVTKAEKGESISTDEIKKVLMDINKSEELDLEEMLVNNFGVKSLNNINQEEINKNTKERMGKVAEEISQDEARQILPQKPETEEKQDTTIENEPLLQQEQQTTQEEPRLLEKTTSEQTEDTIENEAFNEEINSEIPKNIETEQGNVDITQDSDYNNLSEEEIENEFRRIQEESQGLSDDEKQLYRDGSRRLDETLRGRLRGVFTRKLESNNSRNGYNARVLKDNKSGNTFDVYDNVDGQTFRDIFDVARTYTENGELVDVHNAEDYDKNYNVISKDGLSGYSITPEGDLVSVFNANNKRGWLRSIADDVKSKAKTLDCYASEKQDLQNMYAKIFGFKTASIMDYDMQYDHDNIAEKHNKPQVAFMVNTDQNVETKKFTDYDEAKAYQESFINSSGGSPNGSSFNVQENEDTFSLDNNLSSVTDKMSSKDVAQILTEPAKKVKRRTRLGAWLKRQIVDKGAIFEDIDFMRKDTRNKTLQSLYHKLLKSDSQASYAIEKGHYGADALLEISKSIPEENRPLFDELAYHWLNVDRMSLEDNAKARIEEIDNEIQDLENKSNSSVEATEKAVYKDDIKKLNEERAKLEEVKNKPVFGETITAEDSRQRIKEIEQEHPEFKDTLKQVYKFLDGNVKLMVENGVISQETADHFKELYPHYVPINRVMDNGNAIDVPLDSRRTTINNPIRKATGGNENIQPLFYTISERTRQTYQASYRNQLGNALQEALGELGGLHSESETIDELNNLIDKEGTFGTVEDVLSKQGKDLPEFTVFQNGQKVTYKINDDIYKALKGQNEMYREFNETWLSKGLKKLGRIRRGLITEYNPIFMLTNPMKDVQDILLNSQHPAETYATIPEAVAQIAKGGEMLEEYLRNGGSDNSFFRDGEFKGLEEIEKENKKNGIFLPLNAIAKANRAIELTPRLAEYIASRKQGKSIETAMLDSARVTTNFSASGETGGFLNKNGFTFLNANIQGLAQQARNVREANAKGLKGWTALAIKSAIAGAPAIVLNSLLWGDDDEYEDLPDYIKDNYYIVAKIPENLRNFFGGNNFLRIPKGRAVSAIQKVVSNVDNYLTNDKKLSIDNVTNDFWEDIKFAWDAVGVADPRKK